MQVDQCNKNANHLIIKIAVLLVDTYARSHVQSVTFHRISWSSDLFVSLSDSKHRGCVEYVTGGFAFAYDATTVATGSKISSKLSGYKKND